jgi:DNA end-binding protein Ku
MSNPVWKGSLAYGTLSFHVKLFSAARAETVHFNQLRATDNSRLKQVLVAEVDDKPVPKSEIVKGYEFEKGRYLVFTDADLVKANPPAPNVLDILAFVDAGQIDPLYLESSYYLAPDGQDETPYAALLGAMRKSGLAGLGRITVSTRERIAAIRPGRTGIILHTLFYADELRRLDEFRTDLSVISGPSLLQAKRAVAALRADEFVLDRLEDTQRKRLLAMIEQRQAERLSAQGTA